MVLACMALEFMKVEETDECRDVICSAVRTAERHYDPNRRILLENVATSGAPPSNTPELRFFNPGHSIETGWFLLHCAPYSEDEARCRDMALDVIEGSLDVGWDREFGGLLYFMDLEGKPTLQLESPMKLWWPHTEALYALLRAYSETRRAVFLDWLEKVDAYSFSHFSDPEHGEWYGYLDRRGDPTHTCKGGNYKGFFHLPRFLLMSAQLLGKL
jgi:N-acylglucosamine 2-epimerase